MTTKYMTPAEVRAALSLAEDLHKGKTGLPPEIREIYRKINQAKRNAMQFMIMFGVVDMSLVDEAVRLMVEKDRLYADWAQSAAKSII